jgi:hypothetical protein
VIDVSITFASNTPSISILTSAPNSIARFQLDLDSRAQHFIEISSGIKLSGHSSRCEKPPQHKAGRYYHSNLQGKQYARLQIIYLRQIICFDQSYYPEIARFLE